MNHGFDVINKALVLNLSWLIDVLFDFHWILIDLGSQLSGYLDFLVGLCDIILENKEHSFVGLQQNFILMNVHVLWGDSMFTNVRGINDAETIFSEYSFIQQFTEIKVRV